MINIERNDIIKTVFSATRLYDHLGRLWFWSQSIKKSFWFGLGHIS